MNLLESAISVIAPHNCLVCRSEGRLLCENCAQVSLVPRPSCCYRCQKATVQSRTCPNCRKKTPVFRVFASVSYRWAAKDLVQSLKFQRAKAAAEDIARIMSENMPILPQKTVITHLPTASSRIRLRGYDQAQLIAKRLAKSRGLEYQDLLRRSGRSRQVGSSKKDRFKQLSGAFSAKQPRKIKGKHILLVDDVLTTGASIESAARELKACGAKRIEAAVFARS